VRFYSGCSYSSQCYSVSTFQSRRFQDLFATRIVMGFPFLSWVNPCVGLYGDEVWKAGRNNSRLCGAMATTILEKNPFTLTEPTQFFHLAAFILISGGISRVLIGSEAHLNPPSSGMLFLTAGVGLWAGMRLSALSLKNRKGSSPQWMSK